MTPIKLFLIGMLMGLADLVPGISSGTVAYSLNIYQTWIDALSSVSLSKLFHLQFKKFFKKIHYHSLVPIILGVTTSIMIFAHVIFLILNSAFVKDIFFLAISCFLIFSCIHFSKNLKIQSKMDILFIFFGFSIAIIFSFLPKITSDDPNAFFVFGGAVIASFAMILPGISGSAVLLLFNLYELLIFQIKEFLNHIIHFQFFTEATAFLGIFLVGVLVGVAVFSSFLRGLLKNHQQKTSLTLFGLMLGCVFSFATAIVKICIMVISLFQLYNIKNLSIRIKADK